MKVIVEFVQCQFTEVEVITIQFQLEKRIQHTFKAYVIQANFHAINFM